VQGDVGSDKQRTSLDLVNVGSVFLTDAIWLYLAGLGSVFLTDASRVK